ncbi:interferon-induced, double-stranded RNA-activated protein kinase-like [Oppia nitens]|uniref:interferon-induced, double-stranded RNA-activated protein kinase-like n=1 Tax=Oppia nitens TaxID=1686743 RepID=UPI0023DA62C4|nr:interferon-induced, double-stranded RNA-activated protein kinase-like [Oppia nitens]
MSSIFADNFDILNDGNTGGFGTVYKVRERYSYRVYAIKKVIINDNFKERALKEVKTIRSLDSPWVVNCFNTWIENNGTCIYIQMEYCPYNLRDIIKAKSLVFDTYSNLVDTPTTSASSGRSSSSSSRHPIDYLISTVIFGQLLQGLDYLHGLKPPVIHRDLKPANILFGIGAAADTTTTMGVTSDTHTSDTGAGGIQCKIGDFGLAVIKQNAGSPGGGTGTTGRTSNTETPTLTVGAGTLGYIAPECFSGKYYTESDVYSLGIIATNLFYLDDTINTDHGHDDDVDNATNVDDDIVNMIKLLHEYVGEMTNGIHQKRPRCSQLLDTMDEWQLSSKQLLSMSMDKLKIHRSTNLDNNHYDDNATNYIVRIQEIYSQLYNQFTQMIPEPLMVGTYRLEDRFYGKQCDC